MTEMAHVQTSEAHIVRRIHLLMPALLQGIAWPLGRFLVHFFTRLSITGKENLRSAITLSSESGIGVIFAINHGANITAIGNPLHTTMRGIVIKTAASSLHPK